MYNLKDRFTRNGKSGPISTKKKTILNTKIGLICRVGRIAYRRKDWLRNVNCELDAAKEFLE